MNIAQYYFTGGLSMTTHEGFIPVEGGKIFYKVHGEIDQKANPLIVAHGGPGGTVKLTLRKE
jgi:hypothetical protein